jgi:sigma-E factor negative regulatory protein RseA
MSTGPEPSPLIDEQLSAWLDDELPAAELELLAVRLNASPELRARVARYSLVGSTLRGSQPGGPSAGLAALQISARVSSALDEISVPAVAPIRRPAARLVPYAAAAGVALVAVALVPLLRPVTGPVAGPASSMAAQTGILPATLSPVRAHSLVADRMGPTGQSSLSPRRLTSYLVYHGEYSGMLSAKLTDSHIVNNRAYAAAVQAADPSAVR